MGPAYSKGKSGFKYKIDVNFQFDKVEKSLRSVRKDIVKLNDNAFKMQKELNKTNKGFGVYIDPIKGKEIPSKPINFKLPKGGAELSSSTDDTLKKIGTRGRDIMKKYMRVDTGEMKSQVRYMQRRRGKGASQVQIGWIRTFYRYFGWQEEGTKTGIKPMNAIGRTWAELTPYANKEFSKFTRKYFLEGKNK